MRPIRLAFIAIAALTAAAAPSSRHIRIGRAVAARLAVRQATPVDLLSTAVDTDDEDTDYELPPVEEVFALMAAASTNTNSTATNTINPGLGLASSPASHPSLSPSSATVPEDQGEKPEEHPVGRRLVFVAVVMLSMIAIIVAGYTISYRRHQLRMNRLDGIAALKREKVGEEKGVGYLGRCSVVDISRKLRSKFSVTSSDYPVSTRLSFASTESTTTTSSDSDHSQDEYPYVVQDMEEREQERKRMMNTAHFFALRSSSMAANPGRHSRMESAPVFGIPRFDGRRDHSRRSRSVSGGSERL